VPQPEAWVVQLATLARLVDWARFMQVPRAVVRRAPDACQRRR